MKTKSEVSKIVLFDNQGMFGSLCPCVKRPFIDCYCANMTSAKIALAVKYCGADYENCELYRRNK